MKKVFTTGQVAKICKVAPRTVSKWFDSGRLRGYRIPGSQDRRIPREHLIRFLKEHGMPLGELEEEGWHKILIVGAEPLFIGRVQELLPINDDYRYETANSGFEAGIQAESFHPDTIIIDLAMGRSEGLQIAQNLRRNAQYESTLIIALASEDESDPDALTQYGYSEAFKKPFDAALLVERIRTLVEERRENSM
jgi:two-component system, OmpR family, response regulator RpaA